MALVRALNSAVSGLRGQQTSIDVIGDNLANSTTTGFKSGRVNFHTLLSQTLSFGTAPQGFLGGVDPLQIGLGVGVAETTKNFSQGELEVTGIATDLGIQGNGFFIMRDQSGAFVYSRDGSFGINPSNLLHNPSNGFIVQGVNADLTTFTINPGGPLENVEIPVGNLTIARATSTAEFDGNLNGGGDKAVQGSVLQSTVFVSGSGGPAATSATPLVSLFREGIGGGPDIDLALDIGDTISISAKKGGRLLPTKTFIIDTTPIPNYDGFGTTLGDLAAFVQRSLGINPGSTSDILYSAIRDEDANPNTVGIAKIATGLVSNGSGGIIGVIASGTNFAVEGVQTDFDVVVFDTGEGAGQRAIISSMGTTFTTNDTLLFQGGPLPSTIPAPDILDAFTVHETPGVRIGTGAGVTSGPGDPSFPSPAGTMRISGNIGLINDLSEIVVNSSDGINLGTFNKIETADGESGLTNVIFFDSLGAPHEVELSFVLETKGGTDPSTTATGNTFRFYAESDDNMLLGGSTGTQVIGRDRVAGTGTVTFSTGGLFLAQNPSPAVTLQIPNTGAATPLTVTPILSGVTGFETLGPSQAFLIEQDGFATGTLDDFSIGGDGTVTGIFSNGITRPLAQVILARFPNVNGLRALDSNNFVQAANSGQAITGVPGTISLGTIRSGVLEASNVDLSREFTRLIIAQRSFQANARVISTSDRLLEELVNVV
jgi:flagellar hook protein FlgE